MTNLLNPPLLEGEYEDRPTPPDPFAELRDQIQQVASLSSQQLSELRRRIDRIEHGLAICVGSKSASVADSADTRVSGAWELWKQKLGGKQAEFIQELLDHGEMSAIQLKIATRSGQQTVYDTIHKLNKLGLISKNGGKFSLKQL